MSDALPPYSCAECGEAVLVTEDGLICRPCGHCDATVIADRSVVLHGVSSLNEDGDE